LFQQLWINMSGHRITNTESQTIYSNH